MIGNKLHKSQLNKKIDNPTLHLNINAEKAYKLILEAEIFSFSYILLKFLFSQDSKSR